MAGVTSNTSVTVAEGLGVVGGTEAEGVAGVTGAGFRRRMCRGGRPRRIVHGVGCCASPWRGELVIVPAGLCRE